uniref:C-type lectin domain-containing protein n=1 Tax=Maylandia zebra TaxID=106582 RepID=A0A3P9BJ16_9CICH
MSSCLSHFLHSITLLTCWYISVSIVIRSCPLFWYSFNRRCYKYVATHMSWADAELYCESQRANLVSIHSEEEEELARIQTHVCLHSQPNMLDTLF